jgi:hypothetical protein
LIGISIDIVIAKTMSSSAAAAENMPRCADSVRNADQISPIKGSKSDAGIVFVNSLFSA